MLRQFSDRKTRSTNKLDKRSCYEDIRCYICIKLWSKAIPCLCKGTNLFYIKVNTPDHNKAGQFEKLVYLDNCQRTY